MGLALDEPGKEESVEIDGISVLMDEQVKAFAAGQVIDYIDDQLRGTGFIVQAESGCC